MKKVITYGTYDLLHYGHIRLLERAKELGDYLIVGVTADAFDRARGKINVKQTLMERIEAVKALGIADEIIVEEYEGQKIDDIQRFGVDIFTVGSDWVGKFDYLKEYCQVVYLDRTEGVSSTELRAKNSLTRLGFIGNAPFRDKIINECRFVNGMEVVPPSDLPIEDLMEKVDALFILSHPSEHYQHVKYALEHGKHVMVESPVAIGAQQAQELFQLANEKGLVLMESIKTAYALAYSRLLLLVKGGRIGNVVSVDVTCTSLREQTEPVARPWSSLCAWGPTALLPIFQILGTHYKEKHIVQRRSETDASFDLFTKIDFRYDKAVAALKVGKGVKSEGELIVSGTKGYIYVPAPWWKTDYFEIRYENAEENRRFFYQLDGEGIRYELVAFVKNIETRKIMHYLSDEVSIAIAGIMEDGQDDAVQLI